MSQQNGASPSVASIEAAPPTQGSVVTTTATSPSASSFPAATAARIGSSTTPQSSHFSRPSSATSTKVQIPKLSATTTELLARITGNIRGTQQQQGSYYNRNSVDWSSFPLKENFASRNTPIAGTMRASSTLIELPTAPFVYSNKIETPSVTPNDDIPTPPHSNGSIEKPNGPVSIAPTPTLTPLSSSTSTSTSASSQHPPNIQLPMQPQPQPAAPTAPRILKISSPAKPPVAKANKSPSNSRQRRSTGTRSKRSKKRRRGDDSDGEGIIRAGDSSSDESDVAPTATQTKSGRHVNRPSLYVPPPSSPAVTKENSNPLGASNKTQEAARKRKRVFRKSKDVNNITCFHCQRGHSPQTNAIVFCDECNRAWHQHCHDPPIDKEVITVKEREWVCRECRPVEISIVHPTVVRSNPSLTSGPLRPPVHPPLVLPSIDVGGERFSADDRRCFLSGLSHTTLVELLVSISDRHPTLPMFPQDMKSLQSSNFPFSHTLIATAPTTLTPSPSVSANAPVPSNSNNPPSTEADSDKPSAEPTRKKRRHYEYSDDESEYEFQDHRLYPRAGNGVQLSTNPDDLDIMQEDPACPTFSHALHRPAQV